MQYFEGPIYVIPEAERIAEEAAKKRTLDQLEAFQLTIDQLSETNADLLRRLAELTPGTKPPQLVPFTIPPLLLNKPFFGFDDGFGTDRLEVSVRQGKQALPRVVRRDYGLADGSSFRREPLGVDLRYGLTVHVPPDYRPVDMNNVFQFHTHVGGTPPYLAFFLWTESSRWRHIQPDGKATDIGIQPIKVGHAYRLEVSARWSRGTDGRLKIWQDGQPVLDYRGPTIRASDGVGPYILFGQYYPSVAAEFDNTLYFTELRRGA